VFLARKLLCILSVFLCTPLVCAQSKPGTLNLIFTTIDVPGAGFTAVLGINGTGEMVGDYGQFVGGATHGFSYMNGSFTYFDYPGETVTVPSGINDSGLITGYTGTNPIFGFLYDGTTFTTIQDGSDSATYTFGINNAGLIVGGAGTLGATRGFELRGQQFKNISPPPGGWIYVYVEGINNFGQIVGLTSGASISGFTYRNGKFQTVSFPGATLTEAIGINDGGTIVGWYNKATSSIYAFALRNGKYISFSYPGAKDTSAYGISASGQIVGAYTLDYQTYHGFVTSPITDADFQ